MRRHRRRYTYEYEEYEPTPYKERVHRHRALVLLDRLLFFLVIPVPLFGWMFQLADIPLVPVLWLLAYTAGTQTLAGFLFLLLTSRDVGGFGKVGFFFTHTRGKRWMTTKEAKQNTYLFGFLMLVLGVLLLLWTFKLM